MNIKIAKYKNRKFFYREGSTDENCIKEVLINQSYKNRNVPFYVEKGEVWLDLGAHIGTFAIYAYTLGVKEVICFEGNEHNYQLLKKNCPEAKIYKQFFTASKELKLPVYKPIKKNDFYRFTILENKRFDSFVDNFYAGNFKEKISGLKMDIEGAEFDLIEKDLLPDAEKLVMEYHFSKDKSMKNFFERIDILRSIYGKVYYQPSIEKLRNKNVERYPGFYDIKVFCIERKK
jgi:FkbM family methyltransferase